MLAMNNTSSARSSNNATNTNNNFSATTSTMTTIDNNNKVVPKKSLKSFELLLGAIDFVTGTTTTASNFIVNEPSELVQQQAFTMQNGTLMVPNMERVEGSSYKKEHFIGANTTITAPLPVPVKTKVLSSGSVNNEALAFHHSSLSNVLQYTSHHDMMETSSTTSSGSTNSSDREEALKVVSSSAYKRSNRHVSEDEDDDEYQEKNEDDEEEEETNHEEEDNSLQVCCCCKRNSKTVSFQKNYSIHQGNIENYRKTFPEYNVDMGISCMTCYHKQWRFTKGLYDPNKARPLNKREGIQKGRGRGSSTSSNEKPQSNATKKKKASSPQKKRKEEVAVNNNSTTTTQEKKKRKVNRNNQQQSSVSTQPINNSAQHQDNAVASLANGPSLNNFTNTSGAYLPSLAPSPINTNNLHHNVSGGVLPFPGYSSTKTPSPMYNSSTSTFLPFNNSSTSTAAVSPTNHYDDKVRLIVKYVTFEDEAAMQSSIEVFNTVIYCDFVPTSVLSIKSLVMSKLNSKLTGYECERIRWIENGTENDLNDVTLRTRRLCNDDTLVIYVR
ncbi:hypothetical protein ABK040_006108 [Willaertia magna]